jgi:TusE/DsrC/DsvC family sulfur relay protein
MPELNVEGQTVEVGEDGFLIDFEDWTEAVALVLAVKNGSGELSDKHWQVIKYLRDYYQEHQIAPMVKNLCKDTGLSLKKIYELFPAGPARGACKIAGLPKPMGCV